MTPPEVQTLFDRIMSELGHEGWTLDRTTADDYCWGRYKRIDLCLENESSTPEMRLVHEIAHIDAPPDENANYHSPAFFARMEELAQRYLGRGVDPYHIWLRNGYAHGFGNGPEAPKL